MLRPRWAVDAAGERQDSGAEFEHIFRQHGAFVGRVLRRFGVRAGDVPDASQDVFLVVHRRLPEFERRAAYRTWLYRICACVAADYRKRAHRRYERGGDAAGDAAVPESQERQAAGRQLAERLECALDRLRDEQRQVFVLYELEELSMAEVAELLACPLKTAFTRLYAARREIAAELRRSGFACAPLALDAFAPWREQAAGELREALAAFGSEGAQYGVPAAGATGASTGVLPAVQAAPHVAYAGALHALATKALSVVSTAGLLAVAAIGLSGLGPGTGLVLADAASPRNADGQQQLHARSVAYRIVPRAVADPAAKLAPPSRTRRSRPQLTRAPQPIAAPAAGAAIEMPPAANPEPRWLRAPEPATRARDAGKRPASVGLDEVLTATSIEGLMRFTPGRAGDKQAFAFLPERPLVRAQPKPAAR